MVFRLPQQLVKEEGCGAIAAAKSSGGGEEGGAEPALSVAGLM